MSRIVAIANFRLLGMAFILMLLVLGAAVSQLFETKQFIGRLSQSHQRMLDFRIARIYLLDAETGQRGFLLTGREDYLEPWQHAQTHLPTHLDVLAASAAELPTQAARAIRLRDLALHQLKDLRRVIEVRQQSGLAAALPIMERDGSQTQMEEARGLVEEALMEETATQTKMRERQLRGVWVTTSMVIASGLLCLGAGINALLLFRKAVRAVRIQRRAMIQRRRALSAGREKSRFMANMSHEIRTPMNAILGFSQLLRDEVQSPRATQYLNAIGTAGENLMGLINDVLDLSKIDAGHVELRAEVINLRDLVASLQLLLSQRAFEKGLILTARVAEECPAWLWLDGLRLRQMLLNLLGNAVKFTSRGSVTLDVDCQSSGEEGKAVTLVISVKDTGRGISPSDLEAIFQPFRQGRRRDEGYQEGTGLGLTITRRLAHLMGGTIQVESVPGEGSQFQLTLPNVEIQAAGPAGPHEPQAVDWNALASRKVLIVDDNAHNREVMGGYFQHTHHRVSFANDGLEAVEAAARDHPDLILMDIRMPRMNGIEATAMIRNNPDLAGIPVIAVTASSLAESTAGIRQSFDGYLRKPFMPSQLFGVVREVLASVRGEEGTACAPSLGRPRTDSTGVLTDPEALATLHALKSGLWPELTRTMAVRGVKAFAEDLMAIAVARNCGPLQAYAAALLAESATYQITRMERTLAQFPALLESLGQGQEPEAQGEEADTGPA